MRKAFLLSALIAFLVTAGTLGVYSLFFKTQPSVTIEHLERTPVQGAVLTVDETGELVPLDFTRTAREVVDAVVHIQSTQTFTANRRDMPDNSEQRLPDPFRDFFGDSPFDRFFRFEQPQGPRARVGSGSGVIINEKGYIVTNNHVIANADDIQVTLHDNRSFKATVVGTDPSTDLALIQIKADELPTLPLVNSDQVKVGEWVLAVGNPLGLTSTVTAGIVSAKGRSINILQEQFAVESFIQTDAAINQGNSGGALVNLDGGLIGINTAIASPTGSYAGYGFAVPSNIVNKVVEDLLQYGTVQRGVLGVLIRSVDGNLAREKELTITSGAYVDSLLTASAAAAAGIRTGDVIIAVDGIPVRTSPQLQELIARHRPGDKVSIKVNRKGQEKEFNVTLNNRSGSPDLVAKQDNEIFRTLGADFETVPKDTARKLDIDGGVKVTKLYAGKLRKFTDLREGFIITKIDGKAVRSVDDLMKALENKEGGVMLEGMYEDLPGTYYYAFGM